MAASTRSPGPLAAGPPPTSTSFPFTPPPPLPAARRSPRACARRLWRAPPPPARARVQPPPPPRRRRGGGDAERGEHRLVRVERAAEGCEIAGLRRLHARLHDRRDLVEEALVARGLRRPARAKPAHRRRRAPRPVAEAEDERERGGEREPGHRRGLAANEAEAHGPERRRRRIDARGMPVEDRLEPAAERELVREREPAARGGGERAQHRDDERRRAAEPGARRQRGAHRDHDRRGIEPEERGRLGHRPRRPLIGAQLRPLRDERGPGTAPHLGDHAPREPGGERRTAVDDRVLAEEDDLAGGAAAGRLAHELDPIARSSSRARPIFTSPSAMSRRRSCSASAPRAPAACETARACSAMWPFWIPSVARARMAARFEASPTAAMSAARSRASLTCIMRSASRTRGCDCTTGPTVETAIGSSSAPTRCPSSIAHSESER